MALFVCAITHSSIYWLSVTYYFNITFFASTRIYFSLTNPPFSYLWPALCNSRSTLTCIKRTAHRGLLYDCRGSYSCHNIPCVKNNESGAIFEWNFKGETWLFRGKHAPLGPYPAEGSVGLRWELNVCLDGVDRAINPLAPEFPFKF